ncbi:hypothetical protein ATANTOWER_005968, partial [Ataeniobius toweri]|nr:hypothetical protein [Ataeniobius toweri]
YISHGAVCRPALCCAMASPVRVLDPQNHFSCFGLKLNQDPSISSLWKRICCVVLDLVLAAGWRFCPVWL